MFDKQDLEQKLEGRNKKPTGKKGKKKVGFWGRVFNSKKIEKTKKVAIIYLKTNGRAQALELESRQGFFNINGRVYHEDRDCFWTMEKERYPLAIIREWDVIPIGRQQWEDKEMQEKFAVLQDHVMKGIRHAERVRTGEKEGMKLNAKTAIVWVIIGIIVISVILGYTS